MAEERYSLKDLQDYIEEQISFSEERIKKYIDKAVEDVKRDIRASVNRSLDSKVQSAVDAANDNKGGQLIVPEETRRELTVAVSKEVTKEVYDFIGKKVLPRVDNAVSMVQYYVQSQDGDEMVNQFRRRVHDVHNKPSDDTKLITGRVGKQSASEKLAEYQKKTLFFNDDD